MNRKVSLVLLLLTSVASGQSKPAHNLTPKTETPHLRFVKEYVRELIEDEDLKTHAEKELGEAQTPNEKFSAGIYYSKSTQLAAARGGPKVDRGHARGKIVRSALPGIATPLEAKGQTLAIRPFAKKIMARTGGENRIKFDVLSEDLQTFTVKRYAFCTAELAFEMHCHHGYRVSCNDNPNYPQIISIFEEVVIPKLSRKTS